jgi:hypothetical protein
MLSNNNITPNQFETINYQSLIMHNAQCHTMSLTTNFDPTHYNEAQKCLEVSIPLKLQQKRHKV